MLRRFTHFFMAVFVLLLSAAVIYINYVRPRILILHSYSLDYIWTKEVNVGLERVFQDQSWVDIRYHYMSAKKFKDRDELRRAAMAARKAVDNLRPDILIAIDDDAQNLVAKYYVDDPHIHIVFAGINGNIEPYGYDKANNVTGILERKPVAAIKEMVAFMGSLHALTHPKPETPECARAAALSKVIGLIDPVLSRRTQALFDVREQAERLEASTGTLQELLKKAGVSSRHLKMRLGWIQPAHQGRRLSPTLGLPFQDPDPLESIIGTVGASPLSVMQEDEPVDDVPSVEALAIAEAVLEGIEVKVPMELPRPLWPDCKATRPLYRALFLGDQSHSVVLDAEHLQAFPHWSPVTYQGAVFVKTFRQWQEFILQADRRADYLLVGGYRMLRNEEDNGYVNAETVMQWTDAHSPVPVLGMNVFNTADGAMLSVGVSPFEQGEVAAQLAFRLLRDHEDIRQMPVMTSQQYVISMRKSALMERKIQLPSIFEAFSRATNNYYE